MSSFFPLETALLSRRFRLFAIAALIGAIFLIFAVAFFAFAAYLALLANLPPWQAALCVGGGALVLGAILLVVAVQALGRATTQVRVAVNAVKGNALVRAAPLAVGLAARNPRLVAAIAAALTAIFALMRAGKSERPKKS
ncbi:hypothetical protein K9U39_07435 [Rhodoblastus acidophilus]|uniref:Phage holin family protein n=1 Tax=Candidatus Rhodoblastus alkanivorans TaxID=2954117 RepID=A0ABS9Z777_9HYPH|nr:hypothetical protein [Candidatus Rhodoblastus alkanivorans]MCI4678741.1 hypothetical protein [Candidatus Rhodoblastus alkanivorans]MCI4683463.1 hypothetical protein [Candidatus Rhodoblastus alkanivorans]MDI4640777.1 hypothetical protein [Rhodoblastus acidophilus]